MRAAPKPCSVGDGRSRSPRETRPGAAVSNQALAEQPQRFLHSPLKEEPAALPETAFFNSPRWVAANSSACDFVPELHGGRRRPRPAGRSGVPSASTEDPGTAQVPVRFKAAARRCLIGTLQRIQ